MYQVPTTFIIGAGASYEIGMPLGAELKSIIKRLLDIRYEYGREQISGDLQITEALRRKTGLDTREQVDEFNRHISGARHIKDAIDQAISIDNFVENQQDDAVETMAKLAIVKAITQAESTSALAPQNSGSKPTIRWGTLQQTWYDGLFKTLSEGLGKNNISNFFNNVTFITFNYDRSLEFFLYHAIQNYYGLDSAAAADIVNSATFIHPYGTVGSLPWQNSPHIKNEYGWLNAVHLDGASRLIRTFSEQIDDQDSLAQIRDKIKSSRQLVFLGMAFHDANLDILEPRDHTDIRRILGTALGISESDINVIKTRLSHKIVQRSQKTMKDRILLGSSLKCADLFYEYYRTLRAP
ncbi:hypothetical protein [Rhizobium sp. L1K21]|uniref:hypothetical protein n=1 Tax=Rhizobium sp. L1K21 TaxID=2954933 RepID=UPI0020938FCC|nr:hypothetical protein [Rhizobium sp. L1K21]MCO6186256.1 hypothetical protein [Rhizobium sp. L1K21]